MSKNKTLDIYDDFINKPKVKTLKDKTLYFSEELIYGYDAGFIDKKDAVSKEELFADYKHSY